MAAPAVVENTFMHTPPALPAINPAQPADDWRTQPPPVESIFSPFTLSLSFSAAVTKAVRAYERDRAHARDQRARAGREKSGHGHGGHHSRKRGAFAELFWLRFGAEYVSDESDDESEDEEEEESDLDEKAAAAAEEEEVDDDHDLPFLTPPMTPRLEPASVEVPLADLLAASLIRRADSVSARDEFEVIPSVRNVIALEDDTQAELEPDDPWEYIGGDSDSEDEEPTPSYAAVVRGVDLD